MHTNIDPNLIFNPNSGRYVKRDGVVGKKIIATQLKEQLLLTNLPPTQIKLKLKITPKPIIDIIPAFTLISHQSIYYFKNHIKSSKLAVFDLDSTLIVTKSKHTFSQSADDWQFAYDSVPEILRQFKLQGYKLIIVSNQSGVGSGKIMLETLQTKLTDIYTQLNLPIEIYFATTKDNFRKPMTDLWDLILQNQSLLPSEVDQDSFYCGDAGGRIKNYLPNKPRDFNITDRYFANNTKLLYLTPEAVFLGLPQEFPYIDRYATDLILSDWISNISYPTFSQLKTSDKNLIIMVGPMASGKSTFSQQPIFKSYTYLNNDTIKSAPKLQKLFQEALNQNQSIIIDNTNPKRETRQTYINSAKAKGYHVYCCWFDLPKILSVHLNQMRTQMTHGSQLAINMIAIHTYYKNLESPTLTDGFDEILLINKIYTGQSASIEAFNKYYYYHYDLD